MSKRQLRPRPTKVNPDYGLMQKKKAKRTARHFLISVTSLAPIQLVPDSTWTSKGLLTTAVLSIDSTVTLDRAYLLDYAQEDMDLVMEDILSMSVFEVKDEPDRDTFIDKRNILASGSVDSERCPLMTFHPL